MAEEIIKPPWKEKEDKIDNKDDFLNGLMFEEVSEIQQMLYILYKDIENLKSKINEIIGQLNK